MLKGLLQKATKLPLISSGSILTHDIKRVATKASNLLCRRNFAACDGSQDKSRAMLPGTPSQMPGKLTREKPFPKQPMECLTNERVVCNFWCFKFSDVCITILIVSRRIIVSFKISLLYVLIRSSFSWECFVSFMSLKVCLK